MRIAIAFLAVAHLALLGGCEKAPEEEQVPTPEPKVESTREIAIPSGSSVSVETSVEGDIRIVVVIPEGHPGAGTYTSTSPQLVDVANDLIRTLDDPHCTASIQVDESGEIHLISHSVTMK
jgi:hypothetical protein